MRRSFSEWCLAVDQALEALCGLSIEDLPECPYKDWWASGMGVLRAAKKAVKMAY